MACNYIVAREEDAKMLVQARIEFVQDMHPEYDEKKMDIIRRGTEEYIIEQAKAGNYVGFLGVDMDKAVVCTGALLIYTLPPLHGQEGRKVGHVLNFFTKKGYRRRGYGKGLMAFMIDYAKAHGFSRLFLNSTEDGAPLYRKAGFQELKDAMAFEIET